MDGVVVAPVAERLEDEQAGEAAEPEVRLACSGRNEPWAQSWKTMKVRRRKPAAGIARARVIQTETSRQRYIATVRAR